MEDPIIIALLKKRDEKAVSMLMEKYGGLCRSLISRILSDKRDAEECVNGVFMRLWESIPPAKPNDLKAYIAKTARNEALMRLRKNNSSRIKTEVPLDEVELFLPSSETAEEATALKACIEGFLKKQSAERRFVFMRRYWFFDPVKDIAKMAGMSESKVTSLLFRTRNALRKHLEKEGYSIE